MEYPIDTQYDGRPLRDFLRYRLRVSAHLLARLKRDERGLLVNGQRVTVRYVLRTGDVVSLSDFPDEEGAPIEPVELDVDIVYEDEHVVIANKPPFMPTHPSHDHHYDTLANALAWRYRDATTPFVFRPVSRLDRNTSGLVTVARNKYASSRLNELMRQGGFGKRYIAVTDGVPSSASDTIRTGMRRTAESIIVREICPEDASGAELAITHYKLINISADRSHSLLCVSPETGRTHQIRVHLASLGTPICGDDLYGTPSSLIPRHALHAAELELIHPISGEAMHLSAPLPDDMAALCRTLFNNERNKNG